MLNRWRKWGLRYIKNHENYLTWRPVEQLNSENIFSRYSDVVLPDGELIYPYDKDAAFSSMWDFPGKDIKLPKWSCVWNFCSECPGIFLLMQKWVMTRMWTFHSFDFITTKIQAIVILTKRYFLIMENMSFMHEYRKFRGMKSYNTENYCTEIIQYFRFSIRILYSSSWKIIFSFEILLHPWKNNYVDKRHDFFVSWHNNFDWKWARDYIEICQVISEQVNSQ